MLFLFILIQQSVGNLLFGFQWLNFTFNSTAEFEQYKNKKVYADALPTSFQVGAGKDYYLCIPRNNKDIPATFVQIVGEYSGVLLRPFPDWWANNLTNPLGFGSITAFEVDLEYNFWLADEFKSELIKLDRNGRFLEKYNLAGATSNSTKIVDISLDLDRGFAYFSDMGQEGLIVLNMMKNESTLVLEKHYSVRPDTSFWITINGTRVFEDQILSLGIGGIALSCDKRSLYYSPISSRNLFVISTQYLRNLDPDIGSKVVDLGYKITASKGIIISEKENMYLSDIQQGNVYYYEQIAPFYLYFLDYFLKHIMNDANVIWPYHITFDNERSTLLVLANQYQNFLSKSIDFESPKNGEFNFWVFEVFAKDRSYMRRCKDVISVHSEIDIPVWIYSLISIVSLILLTLMICAFKHYRMLKKRHRTLIYAS